MVNFLGQIETFLHELRYYISMCEEEQRVQVSSRLPTVNDYMCRRMGSSAVGVCLALTE